MSAMGRKLPVRIRPIADIGPAGHIAALDIVIALACLACEHSAYE
jgi:hypothetical protein